MEEKKTLDLKLPVFVLEDAVLLPGAVARLETDANATGLARKLSRSEEKRVVVALSTESELGVAPIATLARVEGVGRDGGVIVVGTGRVRVLEFDDSETVPSARVEEIVLRRRREWRLRRSPSRRGGSPATSWRCSPRFPAQVAQALDAIKDPGALADLLAHQVPADAADKQKALETLDPAERLQLVVALLVRRREVLKAAHDIEGAVQQKVSKAEREHILRKKLEAIQNELGEGPDSDKDELAQKLAALKLPEEVRSQIDKELARSRSSGAVAGALGCAHLATMDADLPWASHTEDNLEVDNARTVRMRTTTACRR